MTRCVFCEIVEGHQPADIVLDEDGFLAFLDTRPVFPGHTLLIPRSHIETLEDLPDHLAATLAVMARRLAIGVRLGTEADGTFVAVNNTVSQSVPHLHVHVVPRTRGDGLRGFFWPRTSYDDDDHRQAIRARIASALPRS